MASCAGGMRRSRGKCSPAPAFAVGGGAGGRGIDGAAIATGARAATAAVHGRIRETRSGSGVRILTESIPGVRSVAVGVWVRQGSAHEEPRILGASHLLEHMVFKGTRTRSPRDIALSLERLGGSLDAFTSREHTSYQARVLSEHLPQAMEVLSDLVLNPLLRDEDLELEREVVLEEISTVEDTPDDLVFELHAGELWDGHPYGHSILGTRESVSEMKAEDLRELHRRRYLEGEVIVAAAGHLDHDALVEMVERSFEGVGGGRALEVPAALPLTERRDRSISRAAAQTHIVVGTRTPRRVDPSRFPLVLLSSAFGGGMSSRLFQRIREELALAYSVFSFQSFHSQAGVAGVYVGTRPEWGDRAVDAIFEEYRRLSGDGLTQDELRQVKDQVKGQVMLSLESTSSRLYRLAGFALYDQPLMTLDDLLETIEGVTQDRVAEAAATWFDPEVQTIVRLGPDEAASDPSP
jgi:predicted Zn-dependent peptidase